MENTNEDQKCRKHPKICELLQMIYSEFQPHSKTIKQAERKGRMGVEKKTSTSF